MVNFAVAFNNPVALTSLFYKEKEALSVPEMLYQSLDETETFIVASHLKDKLWTNITVANMTNEPSYGMTPNTGATSVTLT